jgi:cell division protein FtsB
MKTLTFAEKEYNADRVVKTDTDIIGYVDDTEVFAFRGITDFSLFELEGDFDPPSQSLSEQLESLKRENDLLRAQNYALADRADFIEDVIAEFAQKVYQ